MSQQEIAFRVSPWNNNGQIHNCTCTAGDTLGNLRASEYAAEHNLFPSNTTVRVRSASGSTLTADDGYIIQAGDILTVTTNQMKGA